MKRKASPSTDRMRSHHRPSFCALPPPRTTTTTTTATTTATFSFPTPHLAILVLLLVFILVLFPAASAAARTCVNADIESCWLGICSSSLYIPTDCTRLHVNTDTLRTAGPAAIAVALIRNPHDVLGLTELRVETSQNGDAAAIAVAEALKAGGTALAAVELYNTNMGDAGAVALAEALAVNTVLDILLLHRNRIANKGAVGIAAALKQNTGSLGTLSLHSNRIGSEGARSIASALKANSKLSTLRLNKNHISDMGAKAIAAAVKVNFALSLLDVRDNQVHTKGLLSEIKASVEENKIQGTREAKERRATGRATSGELCLVGSECASGSCKTRCCSPKGQPNTCLECGLAPSRGDCAVCGEGLTLETPRAVASDSSSEKAEGTCRKQTAKEMKLVHAAEVAADERADFDSDEAERVAEGTVLAESMEKAGQDNYQWVLTSPFEFQTSKWLPANHAVTIKAQVIGKSGIKVGIRTEAGRDYGLQLANCCHDIGGNQRTNAAEAQQSCIPADQCTEEGDFLLLGWDPARTSAPFTFQSNSTSTPHRLFQRIRIKGRVRLYAHLERGSHLRGLTVLSKEEAFQAEMYRRGASKANAAGDGTDDNESCLRRERKKCFASNHDTCCGEKCWPVCKNCDSASTDAGGFCMCFPLGYYRDGRLIKPGGACLLPPGDDDNYTSEVGFGAEGDGNSDTHHEENESMDDDHDDEGGSSKKVIAVDKPSKLRKQWANRQEL